MKKKLLGRGSVFAFLLPFIASSHGLAWGSAGLDGIPKVTIVHNPVQKFIHGEKLEFTATILEKVDFVRFFFRPEGIKAYQLRNMKKSSGSTYAFILDTSSLARLQFEYFLLAGSKGRFVTFPEGAPQEVITVVGESKEPLPEIKPEELEVEKKKFKLPLAVGINGSIESRLKDTGDVDVERSVIADGNVKLSKHYQKGNLQTSFEMNSAFTNHPLPGNRNMALSNLTLSVRNGGHSFLMGDISVSSSSFTVFGLGRRGLDYQFNNQKVFLQIFNLGSQQQKGWEGFFPQPRASLYGGALGYELFDQKLNLKAVYVSGQDDPARGKNVSSSFLERKKGNVWAVVGGLKLFGDKINLAGEFAQSNYDANLDDEEGLKRGKAWSAEGSFSYAIFDLRGSYQLISRHFNSIGFQFFSADREAYSTSLGVSLKNIRLNLAYADDRNNTARDPEVFTSSNQSGEASLNWSLTSALSLAMAYRTNNQKTFMGDLEEEPLQKNSGEDYSLGLDLGLSQGARINFSASRSAMKSRGESTDERSSLTMNLGAMVRLGSALNLSPTFSYGKAKNELDKTENQVLNALLNADLNIIPQALSFNTSSSYNRTTSGQETMENITVSSNLNLTFGWIWEPLAGAALSLKIDLRQTKSFRFQGKTEAYFLIFNFSF